MLTWRSIRHFLRFLLPLLLLLAGLTWVSVEVVDRTGNHWFKRDLALRADLAAHGAAPALVGDGRLAPADRLRAVLEGLLNDELVVAAGVYDAELRPVQTTGEEPAAVELLSAGAPPQEAQDIGGRRVFVSLLPLQDEGRTIGHLALVQDLAAAQSARAMLRLGTLAVLVLLTLAALGLTMLAARVSWRAWTDELYNLLANLGGLAGLRTDRDRRARTRRFQPVLRDVRELAERLAEEAQAEGRASAWTPARLRATLKRYLRGERVILCANREPYIHERDPGASGGIRLRHPASGLVTALEPVMRACSGVWVAHGSGSADRDVVDRHDHVRVPPGEESYVLRRVWLTPEEEQGYYYGLANEGLWPLCHIADARPTFRNEDWAQYRAVNRRFADAVCEEAEGEDPVVFVQDYHFGVAPQRIRERLPRATILTFWHIPWPNSERIGICPWVEELLTGMLGSSILGFHTQAHCLNFLDAVDRFLEARIDREQQAVVLGGHTTLVRAYPISIEWPSSRAQGAPEPAACRAALLQRLGLPADVRIGLGVDRLDYTKGIEERLLAVERLLEREPRWRGRFTFVQIAAPSRTAIPRYQRLSQNVNALVARINERLQTAAWRPIVLLEEHHEPDAIVQHYRAADVVYISSLHDGMNLVAKEFVAARDDEQGVLVLSRFTGAARELTEALVVNPYDVDEAAAALGAALEMPPSEQAERMRAMRLYLSEFNVYRWAGRMIVDAARVRQRVRFVDRLRSAWPHAPEVLPTPGEPGGQPVRPPGRQPLRPRER